MLTIVYCAALHPHRIAQRQILILLPLSFPALHPGSDPSSRPNQARQTGTRGRRQNCRSSCKVQVTVLDG